MPTILPPYLKEGDSIGLVCPAGYMAEEKFQTCIQTLEQWGFCVAPGKTPGHQFHYFSGTDLERLDDLQHMLDDPAIKAVLCARGGYGTGRIIDQIDFSKFVKKPKWIIGFSDITILHSHIYSNFNIASLHAPMAAAFNDGEAANPYVRSLHDALTGKKAKYTAPPHENNRTGKASGILVGGNLSLLAHLVGTPSAVKMKNKILFVEDVGEYIYGVDRMMYQLRRSGMLEHLKGFIAGGFTDMKDTDIPFGQNAREVIAAHLKDYDYPVCYDFPISHSKENYALKVGGKYGLIISANSTKLTEI